MSLDIHWDQLDEEVEELVRMQLNDRFDQLSLPDFCGGLHVTSFSFGSRPPEIALTDITDPYPEFYLPDPPVAEEEREEDKMTRDNISFGPETSPASWTSQDGEGWRESLVSAPEHLPFATSLSAHLPLPYPMMYRPPRAFSVSGSLTRPGQHLMLSRDQGRPEEGNHRGTSFRRGGPSHPNDPYQISYPSEPPRTPKYLGEDHPRYSDQSSRYDRQGSRYGGEGVRYDGDSPRSPPPHSGWREEYEEEEGSPLGMGRAEDVQFTVNLEYKGDMRLVLQTELRLNFPSTAFLSLPVRLVVTDLAIKGNLRDQRRMKEAW